MSPQGTVTIFGGLVLIALVMVLSTCVEAATIDTTDVRWEEDYLQPGGDVALPDGEVDIYQRWSYYTVPDAFYLYGGLWTPPSRPVPVEAPADCDLTVSPAYGCQYDLGMNEVPLPPAAWLFLSALAGLGWVKRRGRI